MDDLVTMAHGSGGKSFEDLFQRSIFPSIANPYLEAVNDGALLGAISGSLVMSTDSHVVSPRVFPGGSLGKLAFCGSVNDLAMMGARPLYLSMAMIFEEGLPTHELEFHMNEIGKLAKKWNIPVVTGDTKVVQRGKGDGLYIATTGLGSLVNEAGGSNPASVEEGDLIFINGAIGNHEIAIMSQRQNLNFEVNLESDCAPLHDLTTRLWAQIPEIKCMRDPTRGGVAAVCNEIAQASSCGIELYENKIPIDKAVRSACEWLGFDPLQLANEGKFIVIAPESSKQQVLECMRSHPLGKDSCVIGKVFSDEDHLVRLRTNFGGHRIVLWPHGGQLPRIC